MNNKLLHTEFILYVKNQQESTVFYEKLLNKKADLNVPGMTEFILNDFCKLGLMPHTGIAKIICPKMPNPELGNGIPRCELYFLVEDCDAMFEIAQQLNLPIIAEPKLQNWGDKVFYLTDLDGHIIAFAQTI